MIGRIDEIDKTVSELNLLTEDRKKIDRTTRSSQVKQKKRLLTQRKLPRKLRKTCTERIDEVR